MKKRSNNPGDAWCSQHGMHPNDCFEIHNPKKSPGAISEHDHRQAIIREHVRRQEESIRSQQEQMSRTVVDARKRFEEHKPAKEA